MLGVSRAREGFVWGRDWRDVVKRWVASFMKCFAGGVRCWI